MKTLLSIMFAIIISSGIAKANDIFDNKPLIALLALDMIDLGQTTTIAGDRRFREYNPILGRYPTQRKVNLYFAALIATDILSQSILSKKWATRYAYMRIGFQLACIGNNAYHGINIRYRF